MRNNKFLKRKRRVRAKIIGSKIRPRLTVFRSNKGIFAQVVDDRTGVTLLGLSSKSLPKKLTLGKSKTEISSLLGLELAKKALKMKIKSVVFDRSGYKYHGRVRSFAQAAREGGLKF